MPGAVMLSSFVMRMMGCAFLSFVLLFFTAVMRIKVPFISIFELGSLGEEIFLAKK
jgi:hypothetical protein